MESHTNILENFAFNVLFAMQGKSKHNKAEEISLRRGYRSTRRNIKISQFET